MVENVNLKKTRKIKLKQNVNLNVKQNVNLDVVNYCFFKIKKQYHSITMSASSKKSTIFNLSVIGNLKSGI